MKPEMKIVTWLCMFRSRLYKFHLVVFYLSFEEFNVKPGKISLTIFSILQENNIKKMF